VRTSQIGLLKFLFPGGFREVGLDAANQLLRSLAVEVEHVGADADAREAVPKEERENENGAEDPR